MGEVIIYGLIDPRVKQCFTNVRYVGKTKQLNTRYNQHICRSKKDKTPVYKWVKSLMKENIKPNILILDKCGKNNWEIYEKSYIELIRNVGLLNNLNVLDGGGFDSDFNKIKVYQYDENGCFIREYESVNDAAKSVNIAPTKISAAINKKRYKSCRGYYWFKSYDNAMKFKFKKTRKINVPIIAYDLDGNFIDEYKSQADAERKTGIKLGLINQCLLNKKRCSRTSNYRWFHKKEDSPIKIEKWKNKRLKPILQYDLNNMLIQEYESIKDAILNTNIKSISNCINGLSKTAGGYKWKLSE